jgi:hypothetical protein
VLLHPPQRPVDPARVALTVVQGALGGWRARSRGRPVRRATTTGRLEEVARFQVGHRRRSSHRVTKDTRALRAREVVRVGDLEVVLVAGTQRTGRSVKRCTQEAVSVPTKPSRGRGRTRRAAGGPGSPAGSAPRRARRRGRPRRAGAVGGGGGEVVAEEAGDGPAVGPGRGPAPREINAELTSGRAPSWMSTMSIASAAMRSASRLQPPPLRVLPGRAAGGRSRPPPSSAASRSARSRSSAG